MPAEKNPEMVYLDTNIISYYFSNLPEYKIFRDATREWWTKKSKNYYLCTSMTAYYELRDGDYLHQEEALKLLEKIALLPINEKIEKTAHYYSEHNLAPKENIQRLRGDALHLAICAFLMKEQEKYKDRLVDVNELRKKGLVK